MQNRYLIPFVFILSFFLLQSCTKDHCEQEAHWIELVPVYKYQSEIDSINVQFEAARELEKPGKIYFYNKHVFVNEYLKGVHIIDNTNPENPKNIAFLNIEGNADIAVRGDRLYADCYTDLVVFDISDLDNIEVVNRQTAVFSPLSPANNSRGMLVYKEQVPRSRLVSCDSDNDPGNWNSGLLGISPPPPSAGGSQARFTFVDDYFYTVSNRDLNVFSLNNPDEPNLILTKEIGWGIETIIPFNENLFIGSNTGMQIWDNSNPAEPMFLSRFSHAFACDPVFVKENYAYVTLRSGNACQSFSNQLDLIDITDLENPFLEETFEMDNPHGLSIEENNLFVCEGDFGLKVFDITNPKDLGNNKIDEIKNKHSYDVIVIPGDEKHLLVVGDDGLFQYDYSNPNNLKEISRIEIKK